MPSYMTVKDRYAYVFICNRTHKGPLKVPLRCGYKILGRFLLATVYCSPYGRRALTWPMSANFTIDGDGDDPDHSWKVIKTGVVIIPVSCDAARHGPLAAARQQIADGPLNYTYLDILS